MHFGTTDCFFSLFGCSSMHFGTIECVCSLASLHVLFNIYLKAQNWYPYKSQVSDKIPPDLTTWTCKDQAWFHRPVKSSNFNSSYRQISFIFYFFPLNFNFFLANLTHGCCDNLTALVFIIIDIFDDFCCNSVFTFGIFPKI